MAGPCVGVVGRRFAEIVESGPYKLSEYPLAVIIHGEIEVGSVTPRAAFVIVAVAMVVGMHDGVMFAEVDREIVFSAR